MNAYATVLAGAHAGVSPYDRLDQFIPVSDFGWNSHDPWLAECIQAVEAKTIIEVGTFHGAAARFMAKAMGEGSTVIAVDTFCGDHEQWEQNRDLLNFKNGRAHFYDIFLRTTQAALLHDRIIPLPMDSVSGARLLTRLGITADMIYLDGGHEFDTVKLDAKNYWELLRVGGLFVADDVNRAGVRHGLAEGIGLPFAQMQYSNTSKGRIFKQ